MTVTASGSQQSESIPPTVTVTASQSSLTASDDTPTVTLGIAEPTTFAALYEVDPGEAVIAPLSVMDMSTGENITSWVVVKNNGCFILQPGRDRPFSFTGDTADIRDQSLAASDCAARCHSFQYTYNADNVGDCYCGDEVAVVDQVDTSFCRTPCVEDPAQFCGGGVPLDGTMKRDFGSNSLVQRAVDDSFLQIFEVYAMNDVVIAPFVGNVSGNGGGNGGGSVNGSQPTSNGSGGNYNPSGTGSPPGSNPTDGGSVGSDSSALNKPTGSQTTFMTSQTRSVPPPNTTSSGGNSGGNPSGSPGGDPGGNPGGVTTGSPSFPTNVPLIIGISQLAINPETSSISIGMGELQERQSGGSFIGNAGVDAPTDCNQGTQFVLSNGQLSSGGGLISTDFGALFTPLAVSASSGNITTTWTVMNGHLTWDNAAFVGGTAGFCQDTSGRVFATFGAPANSILGVACAPVNLVTYPGKSFFLLLPFFVLNDDRRSSLLAY